MYTYVLGKGYIGFKVSNTFIIALHTTCRMRVGKGGERGRERERERETEREREIERGRERVCVYVCLFVLSNYYHI